MRFRIEGGPKVEAAYVRLYDLATYTTHHGRNAYADAEIWSIARELFEAGTGEPWPESNDADFIPDNLNLGRV